MFLSPSPYSQTFMVCIYLRHTNPTFFPLKSMQFTVFLNNTNMFVKNKKYLIALMLPMSKKILSKLNHSIWH